MLYYEAIIDYVKRCPRAPLQRADAGARNPRGDFAVLAEQATGGGRALPPEAGATAEDFHRTVPEEEARAIYAVREASLSPAPTLRLAIDIRPEVLRAVVEAYPCVRRDLADAFINLFTQL